MEDEREIQEEKENNREKKKTQRGREDGREKEERNLQLDSQRVRFTSSAVILSLSSSVSRKFSFNFPHQLS